MKKLFYPAIFETEESGYSVHFPDLEGCNSCGESMEEAYEMAGAALGLMISYLKDEGKEIPAASNPVNIKTGPNQAVVIVELDYLEYLKRTESRSVKKNLTIPSWLAKEAEQAGVNFSQVLQEALMIKLNKQ